MTHLGELNSAHAEAAEVLRLNPKYSIDGTQKRVSIFKRGEDLEHLVEGLRKAGLPEIDRASFHSGAAQEQQFIDSRFDL